jgi:hypothetical protein
MVFVPEGTVRQRAGAAGNTMDHEDSESRSGARVHVWHGCRVRKRVLTATALLFA